MEFHIDESPFPPFHLFFTKTRSQVHHPFDPTPHPSRIPYTILLPVVQRNRSVPPHHSYPFPSISHAIVLCPKPHLHRAQSALWMHGLSHVVGYAHPPWRLIGVFKQTQAVFRLSTHSSTSIQTCWSQEGSLSPLDREGRNSCSKCS